MNDLLTEWTERFVKVWDPAGQGMYRMGSPGQRIVSRFVDYLPEGAVVNEYGSGTGRAVVALSAMRPDLTIHMVDLAANAMEPAAARLLGNGVDFRLLPLWDLGDDFPVADWGYCIDVLMCVPPAKLTEILWEIRRTCRNLFCQVYDWDDFRLGINYTTIKGDAAWWRDTLSKHWPSVTQLESTEHAQRYIFVCKGGAE
jgi:hypothetical protein